MRGYRRIVVLKIMTKINVFYVMLIDLVYRILMLQEKCVVHNVDLFVEKPCRWNAAL